MRVGSIVLLLCVSSSEGFSVDAGDSSGSKISFDALKDKKVLVVGGSGRVGGSIVTQLTLRGAQVTVGGRRSNDDKKFARVKSRWASLIPEIKDNLQKVDYMTMDREVASSVRAEAFDLVATFLILAEKALTVVNGRRQLVDAMKDYSRINFGPRIGSKEVAHLNLLETASIADNLGIGNVKSLFGTAPGFWNALLGTMAQLPSSLLANESLMRKLSVFSMPIVRLVDAFAGATNAMRVDVSCAKMPDLRATAIYAHENLEPCVGESVTAFAAAILTTNKVEPGVWFPEEAITDAADTAAVLHLASAGAHTTLVDTSYASTREEVWGGNLT